MARAGCSSVPPARGHVHLQTQRAATQTSRSLDQDGCTLRDLARSREHRIQLYFHQRPYLAVRGRMQPAPPGTNGEESGISRYSPRSAHCREELGVRLCTRGRAWPVTGAHGLSPDRSGPTILCDSEEMTEKVNKGKESKCLNTQPIYNLFKLLQISFKSPRRAFIASRSQALVADGTGQKM